MAFTIENNKPSVGCIQWTGLNMQYKGVNYAIVDGYTNYAYSYWTPTAPNNLVVTNTFPTLGVDDCLVFLNKSGTSVVVPNSTVVSGDLIVPASIVANAIASNTITGDKLIADAITSREIATGAVTADSMAVGSITANAISANAIGANAIASSVITGDKLVADTITAREIASKTITANEIVANTITASEIASGTITATQIASGTIDATRIASNAITISKVDASLQSSIFSDAPITTNSVFSNWTSTYPVGFSTWGTVTTTKETTLVRAGLNAVRYTVTALGQQAGINMNSSAFITNISNQKYLYVEIGFMLVSGALTGAGVLLDWNGMSPSRVTLKLTDYVSAPTTGKWYTVKTVVQRPTDTSSWTTTLASSSLAGATSISVASASNLVSNVGTITLGSETKNIGTVSGTTVNLTAPLTNAYTSGATVTVTYNWSAMGGYLMGNYSSIGDAVKDIIFDSLFIREPSQQEIDLYANKANWVDAKAKVDLWKHASDYTKIDGGDIYTGTITANAITAGTITSDKIAVTGITADKIKGNTLTLGGSANVNGLLSIKDATGVEVVKGDNTGILIDGGFYTIKKDGIVNTAVPTANLVGNPSFENCTTTGITGGDFSIGIMSNWAIGYVGKGTPVLKGYLANSTADEDRKHIKDGSYALKVNSTNFYEQMLDATAGDIYTISAYVKRDKGAVNPVTSKVVIHTMDETNSINTITPSATNSLVINDDVWHRHVFTFTVPTMANKVISMVVAFTSTDANWLIVDCVQVVNGSLPALYFPDNSDMYGGVIADRIKGGTLTLGGTSGASGKLTAKDGTGADYLLLTKDGMQILSGKLRIGTVLDPSYNYTSFDGITLTDKGITISKQGEIPFVSMSGSSLDYVMNCYVAPVQFSMKAYDQATTGYYCHDFDMRGYSSGGEYVWKVTSYYNNPLYVQIPIVMDKGITFKGIGSDRDVVNSAPWYGIGLSDIIFDTSNALQIASYWGLRLRASTMIMDINRTEVNFYNGVVKTDTRFYQQGNNPVWGAGDLGLEAGGTAQSISGLDLNNIKKTGFYRGSSLGNAPVAGTWLYVWVITHDNSGYVRQQAQGYWSDDVWVRRYVDGANWTAWRRIVLNGEAPRWQWYGTLNGDGTEVWLTHNLGYNPTVEFNGTRGNIILTHYHPNGNQVVVCNYNNGNNSWTGYVNLR